MNNGEAVGQTPLDQWKIIINSCLGVVNNEIRVSKQNFTISSKIEHNWLGNIINVTAVKPAKK